MVYDEDRISGNTPFEPGRRVAKDCAVSFPNGVSAASDADNSLAKCLGDSKSRFLPLEDMSWLDPEAMANSLPDRSTTPMFALHVEDNDA